MGDDGKVMVDRVVCAVDCGAVVNPDTVEAQMVSGIVYGLTATLKSEITLAPAARSKTNFHNFKLLRMTEIPPIEVHLVQEKPGGAGEPGTPPIAPAVANAIFAATGKRVRTLPIGEIDLTGECRPALTARSPARTDITRSPRASLRVAARGRSAADCRPTGSCHPARNGGPDRALVIG